MLKENKMVFHLPEILKIKAAAKRSEAMEADTISKNGRSLKSQMSKGNFLKNYNHGKT